MRLPPTLQPSPVPGSGAATSWKATRLCVEKHGFNPPHVGFLPLRPRKRLWRGVMGGLGHSPREAARSGSPSPSPPPTGTPFAGPVIRKPGRAASLMMQIPDIFTDRSDEQARKLASESAQRAERILEETMPSFRGDLLVTSAIQGDDKGPGFRPDQSRLVDNRSDWDLRTPRTWGDDVSPHGSGLMAASPRPPAGRLRAGVRPLSSGNLVHSPRSPLSPASPEGGPESGAPQDPLSATRGLQRVFSDVSEGATDLSPMMSGSYDESGPSGGQLQERLLHLETRLAGTRFARILKPAFEELRTGTAMLSGSVQILRRQQADAEKAAADLKAKVRSLEVKVGQQATAHKLHISSIKAGQKEQLAFLSEQSKKMRRASGSGAHQQSAVAGVAKAPVPKGDAAFASVQVAAGDLWTQQAALTESTCSLLQGLAHDLAEKHNGYEIESLPDCYVYIFHTPISALGWALELLAAEQPDATEQLGAGLPLIAGIHWGRALTRDLPNGRVEHFGLPVNVVKSLPSQAAAGGECIASDTAHHRLQAGELRKNSITATSLGDRRLKGANASAVHCWKYQIQSYKGSPALPPETPATAEPGDFFNWAQKHEDKIAGTLTELVDLEKSLCGPPPKPRAAPKGKATILVAALVDRGEELWDLSPQATAQVFREHYDLLRSLAEQHRGFPARNDESGLLFIFGEVGDAINFSLNVHRKLLAVPPPADASLAKLWGGDGAPRGGHPLWRGLTARVAVHAAENRTADAQYSGEDHDIVFGALRWARSGATVLTGVCIDAAQGMTGVEVRSLVFAKLGAGADRQLAEVLPVELAGRTDSFGPPSENEGVALQKHVRKLIRKKQQELALLRSVAEEVVKEAKARKNSNPAPSGTICMVFTDVHSAHQLWEADADVMLRAVKIHNAILREGAARLQGYEVRTEGESFVMAFPDAGHAFQFCCEMQTELLKAEWPEELLKYPAAATGKSPEGTLIWCGLRVSMGLHLGAPHAEVDPATGRTEYFGAEVNVAARVTRLACGGEIVLSSKVHGVLAPAQRQGARVEPLGLRLLGRGVGTCEVFSAVPSGLQDRKFHHPESTVATQPRDFQTSFNASGSRKGLSASGSRESEPSAQVSPLDAFGLSDLRQALGSVGQSVRASHMHGANARNSAKKGMSQLLALLEKDGDLADTTRGLVAAAVESVGKALEEAALGVKACDMGNAAVARLETLAEPLVAAAAAAGGPAGGGGPRALTQVPQNLSSMPTSMPLSVTAPTPQKPSTAGGHATVQRSPQLGEFEDPDEGTSPLAVSKRKRSQPFGQEEERQSPDSHAAKPAPDQPGAATARRKSKLVEVTRTLTMNSAKRRASTKQGGTADCADEHDDSGAVLDQLRKAVAGCHRLTRLYHQLLIGFFSGVEGDFAKERVTEDEFVTRFTKEIERLTAALTLETTEKRAKRSARAVFSETMKLATEGEDEEERLIAASNFRMLVRSIPALLCKSFHATKTHLTRAKVRDKHHGAALSSGSSVPLGRTTSALVPTDKDKEKPGQRLRSASIAAQRLASAGRRQTTTCGPRKSTSPRAGQKPRGPFGSPALSPTEDTPSGSPSPTPQGEDHGALMDRIALTMQRTRSLSESQDRPYHRVDSAPRRYSRQDSGARPYHRADSHVTWRENSSDNDDINVGRADTNASVVSQNLRTVSFSGPS